MDSSGSDTENRNSAAPEWFSLPAEIRLMILECAPEGSWTACATVCKEWQAFIEPRNFQNLHLQIPCLEEFEAIISPRVRPMVRNIWLNMELRPYSCRCCTRAESYSWTCGNNKLMRGAISKLYIILAAWKPDETVRGGIDLELSAQSPSDREHWFKNWHFYRPDGFANGKPTSNSEPREPEIPLRPYHDPCHGWQKGQRVSSPNLGALGRVHKEIDLNFKREPLPSVASVKRFRIRRHCRRQFSTSTLQQLLEKLTGLKEVVYQPWLADHDGHQAMALLDGNYDANGTAAFLEGLPKRVEKIKMFEHVHESFVFENSIFSSPAVWSGLIPSWDQLKEQPVLKTSRALARRSHELKSVSVAFMADARYFFRSCGPTCKWERLRSLILTSKVLTAKSDSIKVSELLQSAGTAALRMPKLEDMAIWNGSKGNACAFTYHRHLKEDRCEIAWRGTWDMEFEPRVIETWQKVALEVAPRSKFRVTKHPKILKIVQGRGEAIILLGLPRSVIDGFPLWCMVDELASGRLKK